MSVVHPLQRDGPSPPAHLLAPSLVLLSRSAAVLDAICLDLDCILYAYHITLYLGLESICRRPRRFSASRNDTNQTRHACFALSTALSMPMAAYTSHSRDRPQHYVAVYRRPPHTIRRTATNVLAGDYGWHEPEDLLALRVGPSPSPALSASLSLPTPVLAAPEPPIVLRDANIDNTQLGGRRAAKAPRGKGKAKTADPARPVDMGVSIIPICAPGTGTPSPSPEPPSPPPHPHPRRPPPVSYASTSSSISAPILLAAVPRRSDFEAGAQRVAGAAAATVGKRSRGPSQSQRQRHPISPPVTSPNTSQSELPPGPSNGVEDMGTAPASAPVKRAREGREAPRRKRRKTETRGEAVVVVPASAPASAPAQAKGQSGPVVDVAVRKPPARRKGWKGWVMVSDTEGSDTERPKTPPVTILEKKTRSGRDFDQDAPRVTRRGRSTVSLGRDSVARSTAPPSSVIGS